MKKIISMVLAVTLALSSFVCISAADEGIKVYLEGNKINFDVQPQTINDRTMVPIRAIFEAMGANVTWDDATQTAISTKDNTTVKMTLNSTTKYINDVAYEMDVTPVIVDGRTLAPARYVAEAFGYTVSWDEVTQTVTITSSASVFDKLKNTIISKGTFEEDNYAYIPYCNYKDYGCVISYIPTEDYINLFSSLTVNSETTIETSIFIERYECPTMFLTVEIPNHRYELYAEYTQFNEPYEEIINTLPFSDDSTENLLNSNLELMDSVIKHSTDISLADFGICY